MTLLFVINFGHFFFVAHFQALITDNFGILTFSQVVIADSFGIFAFLQVLIVENFGILALFQTLIAEIFCIFNILVKNKNHPGLEPMTSGITDSSIPSAQPIH